MAGVLHRYGSLPHQLAFVSHPRTPAEGDAGADASTAAATPTLHAVLLSGLTEGLLALPYAPNLAERCSTMSPTVALVQAQLRSSYDGWGRASLNGDADELLMLLQWLRKQQGSLGVVLVGHSTGCQIAARFCERHHELLEAAAAAAAAGRATAPAASSQQPQQQPLPPTLYGVVLQAPVSDREYFFAADPAGAAAQLADARKALAEGEPERLIAVVEGSPLSARRAAALLERLGDDDMFSRDLTDDELRGRTSLAWVGGQRGGSASAGASQSPLKREVMVLASGADEYALPLLSEEETKDAERVKSKLEVIAKDARRLAAAAGPGARAATIAGARHNGGGGKEEEVAEAIADFVRRASKKPE
jgi:pimeloyl-ACP methyl ester carboxylesterase